MNQTQNQTQTQMLLDLVCPDCGGSLWPDMDDDDCLLCNDCIEVWERP